MCRDQGFFKYNKRSKKEFPWPFFPWKGKSHDDLKITDINPCDPSY